MSELEVQIRNYQALKKANYKFVPGINLICGPTNAGKSSMFRALKTAIFNLPNPGHVSLGETKTLVGIRYNGHQVVYRRDLEAASQVAYSVDGKVYAKLGKGQPELVGEVLGIKEIDVNDNKYKINFANQMDYPFLLDQTPSEVFKFVMRTNEEDVAKVLDQMRSDLNEISSNVKSYDESRNQLGLAYQREAKRHKEKKGYKPYCDRVLSMEAEVHSYEKLLELVQIYENSMGIKQESETRLKTVERTLEVLGSLDTMIDSMSIITDIQTSVDRYEKLQEDTVELQSKLEESITVIQRLSGLEGQYEVYQNLTLVSSRVEDLTQSVQREEQRLSQLEEDKMKLQTLEEDIKKYQSYEDRILLKMQEVESERQESYELKLDVDSYESELSEVSKCKSELESIDREIQEIEEEIRSIGVCPYCGSELGGEEDGCKAEI